MSEEPKTRTQITVVEDVDIVTQLDAIAKAEGLQRADILRRAIRRYLLTVPSNYIDVTISSSDIAA